MKLLPINPHPPVTKIRTAGDSSGLDATLAVFHDVTGVAEILGSSKQTPNVERRTSNAEWKREKDKAKIACDGRGD